MLHFEKVPSGLSVCVCGEDEIDTGLACSSKTFMLYRSAMGTILARCTECDEQFEFEQLEQAPDAPPQD